MPLSHCVKKHFRPGGIQRLFTATIYHGRPFISWQLKIGHQHHREIISKAHINSFIVFRGSGRPGQRSADAPTLKFGAEVRNLYL